MKKMLAMLIVFTLVFSTGGMIAREQVYAAGNKDNGIKVLINGEYLKQDAKTGYAQVVNGSVMVPYRAILNHLGVKDSDMSYNKQNKVVRATLYGTTVAFAIGSDKIYIKYEDEEESDVMSGEVPAYVDTKVNRTYVSARTIATAFDFDVEWSNKYKTVIIKDDDMLLEELGDVNKDFSKIAKALSVNAPEDMKTASRSDMNMTLEMVMGSDMVELLDIQGGTEKELKVKAKITGISKADNKAMEGTLNLNMDMNALAKLILAGEQDEEEKKNSIEIIQMLQNMDVDYKYDVESGMFYINSPQIDKIATMKSPDSTRIVGKSWYKMDLSELYEDQGIDYEDLVAAMQGGGTIDISTLISLMMSQVEDLTYKYDEKTDTTEAIPLTKQELQAVYDTIKSLIGDKGLKKSTESGKEVFSANISKADFMTAFVKNKNVKNFDMKKMLDIFKELPEVNMAIKYVEDNGKPYTFDAGLKLEQKDNNFKIDLNAEMTRDRQKIKMLYRNDDGIYFNIDADSSSREYYGPVNAQIPANENILDMMMLLATMV